RLGWAVRALEGCFLLVADLDDADGFTVPTGVLTDRQVNRTWDQDGFSIALRPDRPVRLTRGQPVARIALLSRETLQARLEEADMEAVAGAVMPCWLTGGPRHCRGASPCSASPSPRSPSR